MRAREEEFVTVAVFDADGVAEGAAAIAIKRLMRAAGPDYCAHAEAVLGVAVV